MPSRKLTMLPTIDIRIEPRTDVAKLIADNLAELPGENGASYKLPIFSTIGQHDSATIQRIDKMRERLGKAITRLLAQNGYTVTHVSDPKPADQPGDKIVTAHCAHCAKTLMRLTVDDHLNTTLHRVALEAMGHPHNCWS